MTDALHILTPPFALAIGRQGITETVPIALAALGEVVVERSGVINIGIEGMMLCGAFAAALAAHATGSPWIGLSAATATGALCAALYALLVVRLRCDQIVTGLGLNLLAIGVTGIASQRLLANQPPLAPAGTLAGLDPLALPVLLLTLLVAWTLYRTMWGLGIRACGDEPLAAASAGLSVRGLRFSAVLIGGALAGLGGGHLAIVIAGRFQEEMVAGRGFVALAMVIFGRWSPSGATLGTLFVGTLMATQQNLQPLLRPDQIHTLYPLMLMAPYVLTLLVLSAGFRSAGAPAALARPW
ncbi:MAG: hypothetical protein CHACPFDD_01889 [Phycisphaerae bacterium]|nr:hypothetical protein [Phycisphaerae bacterium]